MIQLGLFQGDPLSPMGRLWSFLGWTQLDVEPREAVGFAIRLALLILTGMVLVLFWRVRGIYRTPLVMALVVWIAATELSLLWYVVASAFSTSVESWLRDRSWIIQAPRVVATLWLLRVMRRPPDD